MNDPALALARLKEVALPTNAAHLPLLLDDINAKVLTAEAYIQQDRLSDAVSIAGAALESLRASPLRDDYQVLEADASLWLGEAQLRTGAVQLARTNLERALRLRESNDNEKSPQIAQAEISLARCLIELGDLARAKILHKKARDIEATHKELGAQFTNPLNELGSRLAHYRG